ncbi:MAG: hypothetical protein ACFFE4_14000 [Candidatus Thorarchaeota archaeon]
MVFRKKKENLLAIGMFSFSIAILLGRFPGTATIIDFLSGLFTGLSITINLAYLIEVRLERNSIMTK